MTKTRQARWVWPALAGVLFLACERSAPAGTPIDPDPEPPEQEEPPPPPARMGPLRVHPDNPRYFADAQGAPVYLAGSHTWNNFQDKAIGTDSVPAFDYDAYLDFLEDHGHNFIRLWTWEAPLGDRWSAHPLPYARTGPGLALDGEPRFDVTRFNEAWFERLRDRVERAQERGIYVSVMLFQTFSAWSGLGSELPWRSHPFHAANNVNDIDGDVDGDGQGDEVHTLAAPEVTALQEAYVRRVVEAVNDLDNVLYEITNEGLDGSRDWQYHMVRTVQEHQAALPNQHPVGMSAGGRRPVHAGDLFAGPAQWVGPDHFAGYREDPPPADGSKVVIVDTDHLWGIGGNRQWVWKSFTRGLHPIFMDLYDRTLSNPEWGWNDALSEEESRAIRLALGRTVSLSREIDLAAVVPRPELSSTGFCLVGPDDVVAYLPDGGEVTLDLTTLVGVFSVQWRDPVGGEALEGGTVSGGAPVSLTSPLAEDAVLLLRRTPG